MSYQSRKGILENIFNSRNRYPICFFNFDRDSQPNGVPGLSTIFHSDTKEVLYRLLKEMEASQASKEGVDIIVYTRGGDTNSVWPIVSLIREFDASFEVIVPFRCHSSGTLLALGASKIHMGRLSELSPIDPSTANAFNPSDGNGNPKSISVEDMNAYMEMVDRYLVKGDNPLEGDTIGYSKQKFLEILTSHVEPLALGNVERVYSQIRELAKNLLGGAGIERSENTIDHIVNKFSKGFYSHSHPINRKEASEVLGKQVGNLPESLESEVDSLLRSYEDSFNLREIYNVQYDLGSDLNKEVTYIGGIVESLDRSYVYETKGNWSQRSVIPNGINLNVPIGQEIPIIPGFPVEQNFTTHSQNWVNNRENR